MPPRPRRPRGSLVFVFVFALAGMAACSGRDDPTKVDPLASAEPLRHPRCAAAAPLTGDRIRLSSALASADLLVSPVHFDPALALRLVDRGWDTKGAARKPGDPILLAASPAMLRIPTLPCPPAGQASARIHVRLAARDGGGDGGDVDLALSSSEAAPVTATLPRDDREAWLSLPISTYGATEAIRVEADPDGEVALAGLVLPVGRIHLDLDGEYRDVIVGSSIREASFPVAPAEGARLRFSLALAGASGSASTRRADARGAPRRDEPTRRAGGAASEESSSDDAPLEGRPGWAFTIFAGPAGEQHEVFREIRLERDPPATGPWTERIVPLPPSPLGAALASPSPPAAAPVLHPEGRADPAGGTTTPTPAFLLTLRVEPVGRPASLALWGSPIVEAPGPGEPLPGIESGTDPRTATSAGGGASAAGSEAPPASGGSSRAGRQAPRAGSGSPSAEETGRRPVPAKRPNVLLVSLDTLRADRIGRVSHGHRLTPNLSRLAAEGVLFTGARTQAPSTLYGHGTMLTGLPPTGHGATTTSVLPARVPYLPEILAGEGYATMALTDDGLLDGRYGFARGFDRFRNVTEEIEAKVDLAIEALEGAGGPWLMIFHSYIVHFPYSPPDGIASLLDDGYAGALGAEIDAPHIKKTVSWMNQARLPVGPEDLRRLESLYDGEVIQADRALGRLFGWMKERGLWENTIVVVTSDHGEEFDEHGAVALHALTCYEELMRVPLIVKPAKGVPGSATGARQDRDGERAALSAVPGATGAAPGSPPGAPDGRNPGAVAAPGAVASRRDRPASGAHRDRTVDVAVRLMDLPATILDLTDSPIPRAMAGRSLAGLMKGQQEPDRETICEIEDARGAAILVNGWKYHMRAEWSVEDPRTPRRRLLERGKYAPEELYDLSSDPFEQVNVISKHAERAREMRAILMQRLRESTERLASLTRGDPAAAQPLGDPEHIERLRALGYVE